ncbi:MAG TPA: serine/threonine-protein kinase, partial [Candidatus Binatia bacterium]|nr:serine/threonine-protein kinase [Candidatus Binatia bacterium]
MGLGLEKPEDQPESASNPVEQDTDAPKSPAESLRGAATGFPCLTEKSGDRIGRYRLLQEIGHGGCGVVYLAEQEEPVRRKVALKVIKLGMDTRQVVARFEAERQALALMDHPNIAKILDAGITEAPLPASGHPLPSSDEGRGQGEGSSVATRHSSLVTSAGRPYFVMELVGGIKITDYCDQHQLTTRQRLELFMQACRAIQHAHQKGIIHRDIKPSNVLVATQDGTAVPKVIDFGIAKATQGPLTDHTLFTAFEQFLGTPAYMSPEQAEVGGLDIDTRSDIYSLGVLLYELLTGKTPFDAKELLAAGLEAMRRTICEKEPPKPSTRLTQELALGVPPSGRRASEPPSCSGTSGVELAEAGTPNPLPAGATSSGGARTLHDTKELVKLLRGDLDWIVMKCLEKDRARRYETASGLARDIERHLNNEPVVASPPSNLYRFQKMVRRNKVLVSAGTVVVTVLVIGAVVSTWQAVRATKTKALALSEKRRADEEAAKQEAINRFLNEMLASADPYELSEQNP